MTFTTPQEDRYFEDYLPGAVHEFGPITIGEDEIIEFARRFDPQPFHIDPEAAKQSVFGGLIASGWHTVSLTMRLLVDHYISRVASLGSPGVDEVRWRKPVRPGDTLSVRVTVLESRLSRSKPNQGTIRSHVEVLNQHREVVMTWKGIGLVRCRNRTDIRAARQAASESSKKVPRLD
jgi:acyl dehydratase